MPRRGQKPLQHRTVMKVALLRQLNGNLHTKRGAIQVVNHCVKAMTYTTIVGTRVLNNDTHLFLEGYRNVEEQERQLLQEFHNNNIQQLIQQQQQQQQQLYQNQLQQRQMLADQQNAEQNMGQRMEEVHQGLQQWLQDEQMTQNGILMLEHRAQLVQAYEGRADALNGLQVLQKERRQTDAPHINQTGIRQCFKHLNPNAQASPEWVNEAYCKTYGVNNVDDVPSLPDRDVYRKVYLAEPINNAASQYEVSARNHVTTNFYGRLISCTRIVATQICPKLNKGRNKGRLNQVVYYTARLIMEGVNGEPGLSGDAIQKEVAIAELNGLLQNFLGDDVETKEELIRALWQYAVEALNKYGTADDVYQRLNQRDFHTLLHWLYQMNHEIGNHNGYIEYLRGIAEDNRLAGLPFDNVGWLLKFEKNFTMLPIANTNKAQHILLDTRAAYYLFKDVYGLREGREGLAYYHNNPGMLWRKVFNLRGIRKSHGWKFANYVTTDGVSLNVHFSKDMTQAEADAARAAAAQNPFRRRSNTTPWHLFPLNDDVDLNNVFGCDPGSKDFVTSVGAKDQDNPPSKKKNFQPPSRQAKTHNKKKQKKNGHRRSRNRNNRLHKHGGRKKQYCNNKGERFFQCSNRRWTHETGSKQAAKSSLQRLASTPVYYEADGFWNETTLYDVKVLIPTAKVVTSQEFLHHCEHVFFYLEDIVNDLMVQKVRRERFGRYMKRQAALDMVCHGITFGRDNAIVVFGDCTRQKSHFPLPIKELIRHLQHYKSTTVIIFDEFRTSKCCSKCAFNQDLGERRGNKMFGEDTKGGKKKGYWPIYGVRVCKNCGVRWNRDINAARNMRLIFLHMVENRLPDEIPVRPFPFARGPQPQPQP